MVTLSGDVVARYPRFSRYNSPYPEHDAGTAVDLYPDRDDDRAPSPVAGDVVDARRVRCPAKPYAVDHDHLLVVDTGDHLARVLHVDPAVEVGDTVAVGDHLGHTVRSGFFAPWVANHLHVAFRPPDANPVRASGSLPVTLDVDVTPVPWDGTGTVTDTGDTWVVLDAPRHPDPGATFAGVATDDGRVLDGGLPHYDGAGVYGDGVNGDTDGGYGATAGDTHGGYVDGPDSDPAVVSLLGTPIGDRAGGHVTWRDVTVTANDVDITGLSLFCGRTWLGAKLVHRDHDWQVGDEIRVALEA